MFGYVLPRRDRLSECDEKRYRSAYCALCRTLGREYGAKARFLVNYDMTFLYFLLHAGKEEHCATCHCPARFGGKKPCICENETLRYCADLSVLLSYWKLRDAANDGKFRLDARIGLLLYRKSYRRAARKLPQIDRVLQEQLGALAVLEAAHCASFDRTADAFASLLRAFAEPISEESERRAAQMLLYHVGRFLYLVDALEDLPRDAKKGAYNPLIYRFGATDGILREDDRAALLDSVEASVSLAASALELLGQAGKDAIVRNTVYLGMPAVLHAVADGSFRKRHKRSKQ